MILHYYWLEKSLPLSYQGRLTLEIEERSLGQEVLIRLTVQ